MTSTGIEGFRQSFADSAESSLFPPGAYPNPWSKPTVLLLRRLCRRFFLIFDLHGAVLVVSSQQPIFDSSVAFVSPHLQIAILVVSRSYPTTLSEGLWDMFHRASAIQGRISTRLSRFQSAPSPDLTTVSRCALSEMFVFCSSVATNKGYTPKLLQTFAASLVRLSIAVFSCSESTAALSFDHSRRTEFLSTREVELEGFPLFQSSSYRASR